MPPAAGDPGCRALRLAGMGFRVRGTLTAAEEGWLRQRGCGPSGGTGPLLEVVDSPPFPVRFEEWPQGGPAAFETEDGRVHLRHRRFCSEIDLAADSAVLFRLPSDIGGGLSVTLRVWMTARMPFVGALPLHGAGVAIDGQAVAFVGHAGAGKSTLAATSPHPVYGDEMVVAQGVPPFLAASGWEGKASPPPSRLAAVVELGRGPGLRFERLDAEAGFRRLLQVALVPPAPVAWAAALEVARRVSREVPFFRMQWALGHPPWAELARALGLEGARG